MSHAAESVPLSVQVTHRLSWSWESESPPDAVNLDTAGLLAYARIGPADIGPPNLVELCRFVYQIYRDAQGRDLVHYWSADTPARRANVTVALGCYLIWVEGWTVDDVEVAFEPVIPFCDASIQHGPGPNGEPCCCGYLTVSDFWRGVDRAVTSGIFHLRGMDISAWEYYAVHGRLSLVVPGKFVAFPGPADNCDGRYKPEMYLDVFAALGVTDVVRLNESAYEPQTFTDAGMRHHDLPFPDGTVPPVPVILRFLDLCEEARGLIAVHCMAGLGRTGTCVALWLMTRGWKATEAVSWLRLVRPGSVLGPQLPFLQSLRHKTELAL